MLKNYLHKMTALWYIWACPLGTLAMRKLKIYLETTLFNFYFDKDREAHAETVNFEIYTPVEVNT